MEKLAVLHEKHLETVAGNDALVSGSKESFAAALRLGLPNRFKDEDWKYTNIAKLLPDDLSLATDDSKLWQKEDLNPAFLNLVMLNGRLVHHDILPSGLKISVKPEARHAKLASTDGLTALSNAFLAQTVCIELPENTKLAMPIRLLNLYHSDTTTALASCRVLINCAKGSELTVSEVQKNLTDDASITSLLDYDFKVGTNARLNYARTQKFAAESGSVDQTRVAVARDGLFQNTYLALGAKLSRFDLKVSLDEAGAEAHFNAANLTRKKQHHDFRSTVHHAVANTRSNQLYKSVLNDQGRCVFNGKVVIAKKASLVDAGQLHHSLLLSDAAEVDTKPQMAIDNDDVKCAHGASIGSLDGDQLFYLVSRGISPKDAEKILSQGFLVEPLLSYTSGETKESLRKDLAKAMIDV